jgi:hypothetical protein
VLDGDMLDVLDIADPGRPVLLAKHHVDDASGGATLAAVGQSVLLGTDRSLRAIDLSDSARNGRAFHVRHVQLGAGPARELPRRVRRTVNIEATVDEHARNPARRQRWVRVGRFSASWSTGAGCPSARRPTRQRRLPRS